MSQLIEVTNNEFNLKTDKYIFLFFTASWCGPCKNIKPQLEMISNKYVNPNVIFYKIDITENEELAEKMNIKSVPTFLLLKDEKIVKYFIGADIKYIHDLLLLAN
jgi:thioredoxin 1